MTTTIQPTTIPASWAARLLSSRWRALPVLMIGTFMIVLDSTITG